MATNENVNKVIYGNQTVMDITDTTAEESDVASGEVFYKADGARSVGTLNADSAVWGNISGTLSDQTDLQNALNAKQNTLTLPLSTANGGTGNANGYIRTGRKSDTTIGYYATAEGYNTTASGISSHAEGEESIASSAMAHAEGYTTTASGRWSHAEGYQAVASGDRSHAEGYNTTASGEGSHSEGYRTVASGSYSHAEGEATTAGYLHQHVQGVYNDNKSTTLFEVGNGTANNARSNAFEVYSDGHINVNGDIYQNGKLYNDKATQGLLKSTVGWTGKNKFSDILLGYRLFGNESEGYGIVSITNGYVAIGKVEKNKKYIVSKKSGSGNRFTVALFKDYPTTTASAGRSTQLVADTSLNTYSFNSGDYEYVVLEANRTDAYSDIEPMLRKADISDSTYEPYHESVEEVVEQIYADNGVLGAKNLLHIYNTSYSGIDTVVNSDGSITSSGTKSSTGGSNFRILEPNKFMLPVGKYILSLGGNVTKKLRLSLAPSTGAWITKADVTSGNEVEFEITSADLDKTISMFFVPVEQGDVINWTYYPMIRLASDPDDTYVPYAMTNRELTEELTAINNGLDDWTATAQVQSDNTVTFTGLNDNYGYKIYYELPSGDSAYTCSKVTKTGSGTSVTLTYTTDAPSGTVCKLRILK